MRKFWYALMLLSVFLVGCNNTDDLWDEVNDLKKRVTALETQIKDLNGNIEALRELCKEGTTITGVIQKDGAYTITLSDGKVLNLVEKTENTALFPLVSVDKDGYWIVSYDNGKTYSQIKDASSNPIKATGTDGATPKFRTDAAGYWQVDYNDGKGYIDVLDENGQKVNALGNGGGSGSETTDKFFKEVTVKEGELYIKMIDGTELSVPIVSDFECSFAAADQSKVHEFAAGETKEFTMTVKGVESTMITAPEGWKVKFSKETGKENVLLVTAPATTTKTKSRATADNATDIAILATHGKFATIAKIQVSVKTVVDYKAMYDAGEDIVIGGVTVNNTTFAEVAVTTEADLGSSFANLTAPSVIFLDSDKAYKMETTRGNIKSEIVIIGKNSETPSNIAIAPGLYFSLLAKDGKLLLKNLCLDLSKRVNYLFNQDGGAKDITFGTFAMDGCKIINMTKTLMSITQNNSAIKEISIENSSIQITAAEGADIRIVSLGTVGTSPNFTYPNLADFAKYTFKNNIVYSNNIVKLNLWFDLASTYSVASPNRTLTIENNTIVNGLTDSSSNSYVRLQSPSAKLTMQKNIFYATKDLAKYGGFCYSAIDVNGDDLTVIQNNKVFSEGGATQWLTKPGGATIEPETASPFSQADLSQGIFISKDISYGANLK